jgi:hypothetical protein
VTSAWPTSTDLAARACASRATDRKANTRSPELLTARSAPILTSLTISNSACPALPCKAIRLSVCERGGGQLSIHPGSCCQLTCAGSIGKRGGRKGAYVIHLQYYVYRTAEATHDCPESRCTVHGSLVPGVRFRSYCLQTTKQRRCSKKLFDASLSLFFST